MQNTTRSHVLAAGALVALLAFSCANLDEKTARAGGPPGGQPGGSSLGAPPDGVPPGPPPDGSGGPGGPGGPGGQGGPGSGKAVSGTAVYSVKGGSETKSGLVLASAKADESVIRVSERGSLVLAKSTITKTGAASSNESSEFAGLDAAVLAESGGSLSLSDSTIATDGDGANAAFATGAGSSITLSSVRITTERNGSRGVDATYGGSVACDLVVIATKGEHSAGLATDRGGGTVTFSNGSVTTAGPGSPGIYSTGAISATESSFTATGSEAAVIEGKNSITLTDCSLSGAKLRGVMLYQSFSGDAEVGTSVFSMTGGTLSAATGPLFYATNTAAVFRLSGVRLEGGSGVLLRAGADRWGTKGRNGATVSFEATGQPLAGDVVADELSSISLSLSSGSTLRGAISRGGLRLDASSSWYATADSSLTSLSDADATYANVDAPAGVTILVGEGFKGTLVLKSGGLLKGGR